MDSQKLEHGRENYQWIRTLSPMKRDVKNWKCLEEKNESGENLIGLLQHLKNMSSKKKVKCYNLPFHNTRNRAMNLSIGKQMPIEC